MKGYIQYIKGYSESTRQAEQALASYLKYGWDVVLQPGIVPETINYDDFPYPIMENSLLDSYSGIRQKIKIACTFNDLHFCKTVLKNNEPMVRIEHDSICIAPWKEKNTNKIKDFCFLSYETAFTKSGHHNAKRNYNTRSSVKGILDFPKNYPLFCKRNSAFKGSIMPPGTAAYILTPSGAKKILESVEKHGLEQSDYMINSHVVDLQYIYPSVATYNGKNLNTSHGFTYD